MNIKIPQHCSKIRYTCHLVNYILLIKDSLAVCPLCVLFKLAGLLCTKLLETGFWLQFMETENSYCIWKLLGENMIRPSIAK